MTSSPSLDTAARHSSAEAPVWREGDRTVVRLDGEHDIATLSLLADLLGRAIEADDADLVVDLSGVTFFSAATIGSLMRFRNSMRRQSRDLVLRSPSRCASRVLVACGLTGLLEPGC